MPESRQVYVISDLHLGGAYPTSDRPGVRGFRMCTQVDRLVAFVDALAAKHEKGPTAELVINGDGVDFLAERGPDSHPWSPFVSDPQEAAERFVALAERDREFFASLGRFVRSGHRLTVLLGNHDIELTLPPVRARLEELMGLDGPHGYYFVRDGEGYVVGDALIEHGNRYDRWNVVDQDGLRRLRSLLSRHQEVPRRYEFQPPAGSSMVSSVINVIKESYPFIDLLKPAGATVPLVLALEPGFRKRLGHVARLALASEKHRTESAAMPSFGGDIASGGEDSDWGGDISAGPAAGVPAPVESDDAALRAIVGDSLGEGASDFLDGLGEAEQKDADIGEDISAVSTARETVDRALGFLHLVTGHDDARVQRRLPALLAAVRSLQSDRSFDRATETAQEYLDAAEALAARGFRYVLFGHTHLAKDVTLDGGARYLNSGTWTDIMRFPTEILSGPDDRALEGLTDFVERMAAGDYQSWIDFRPTYVRLDVADDGRVAGAELLEFEDGKVP